MLDEEENGAKVLRNVFKICKKYLHHIQNSVFAGEVTKGQLEALKYELKKFIRDDKDSMIIYEHSSNKWVHKKFLGKHEDNTSKMV